MRTVDMDKQLQQARARPEVVTAVDDPKALTMDRLVELYLDLWRLMVEQRERAEKAEADAERKRKALGRIHRWDGFPRVADHIDPTKTVSYGYAYGSNGERDYMRQVAAEALAPEEAKPS